MHSSQHKQVCLNGPAYSTKIWGIRPDGGGREEKGEKEEGEGIQIPTTHVPEYPVATVKIVFNGTKRAKGTLCCFALTYRLSPPLSTKFNAKKDAL
jgi:hypothetical protein